MAAPAAKLQGLLRQRSFRLGALAVALVLTALVGLFAYRHHSEGQAKVHLDHARAALDAQDLETAEDHLRRYVQARPDRGEGQFLLATTLRRQGKYAEAERALADARRLGWDAEAVRREASLAWLQRHGVNERSSQELLASAQARSDRDMLEALYRGDLAVRNWDRADGWLQLWIKQHPDDWAPHFWHAEILQRFRNYDLARAEYLRVLELCPDQARALLGLGQIALDNRADYVEAEKYLGGFLETHPGHPQATLGLARCKYGRGDLAGARAGAEAVLCVEPRNAGAALLLGTVEAESGRDREAMRWLGEARTLRADPLAVSYQLAQVLGRMGPESEAAAARRRFDELRGVQRSLEAAQRAATAEPRNADLQFRVGQLYLELGETEQAEWWLMYALKQDPTHQPSHAALADHYERQPGAEAAQWADFHRRRAGTRVKASSQ